MTRTDLLALLHQAQRDGNTEAANSWGELVAWIDGEVDAC